MPQPLSQTGQGQLSLLLGSSNNIRTTARTSPEKTPDGFTHGKGPLLAAQARGHVHTHQRHLEAGLAGLALPTGASFLTLGLSRWRLAHTQGGGTGLQSWGRHPRLPLLPETPSPVRGVFRESV